MADGIELTDKQVNALTAITADGHRVLIHQLSGDKSHSIADIYVTVVGTNHGLRITPGGAVSEIGATLPVP